MCRGVALCCTAVPRWPRRRPAASRAEQAAERFVGYGAEILPDPRWAETYRRTQPVFDRLYQALYDASTPWPPPRGRRNRDASQPLERACSDSLGNHDASRLGCIGRLSQLWRISVPSTFRHSRMNAASAVQPFAETIVPST